MIQHHPSEELLRQYCQGSLDDVLGMMVAAHVHLCDHCQARQASLNAELAASQLEFASAPLSLDEASLAAMLSHITAAAEPALPSAPSPCELRIQGRTLSLPPVLSLLVTRAGPWNHVLNELWQSPVVGHGLGYQVDFIYMDAGGGVPSHTHRGREMTLVLDGAFEDESGKYQAGDFVVKTSSDQHRPQSPGGCLCLAAIDSPLHFTSGLSRILNPFSHLFFRSEA